MSLLLSKAENIHWVSNMMPITFMQNQINNLDDEENECIIAQGPVHVNNASRMNPGASSQSHRMGNVYRNLLKSMIQ